MRTFILLAGIAVVTLSSFALAGGRKDSTGDPVRGAAVYESRCGGCHSLDHDRIGPRHRGVFGRVAGSVPGYAYSQALRRSAIVWDADTLDRWLTNPQRLVPGQKMGFRLSDAGERADVIAFLRRESTQ